MTARIRFVVANRVEAIRASAQRLAANPRRPVRPKRSAEVNKAIPLRNKFLKNFYAAQPGPASSSRGNEALIPPSPGQPATGSTSGGPRRTPKGLFFAAAQAGQHAEILQGRRIALNFRPGG